jgi:predicted membrane protein
MFLGLGKGFSNLYGIYATSNRIVGVKPSAAPFILIPGATIGVLLLFSVLVSITKIALLYLAAIVLIIVLAMLIWSRMGKKNPTSIPELDVRKSFEILRKNISRIELKNAGLGSGHLRIVAVDGNSQNLRISNKIGNGYDDLKNLLQEFCSTPPRIELLEGV